MEEAIACVEEFIRSGQPHQIVPINASKLWQMERNPRLSEIVTSASLVIAERAILIGSRILGEPIKDHVGGIMLLKQLLPVANTRGYRMYFLGAKPEIINQMVTKLGSDYPAMQIVGWHHGYLNAEEGVRIISEIRATKPDMLFVAMGTPKQEYWIAEHLQELGVPVCLGVGGSFDVLAGIKKDTPQWIRNMSMEWLYRLVQDPGNLWKRYFITIPWFIYKIFQLRLQRMRLSKQS
ncbi:MAG: WecB/TagA/CpsF family glycosyltransferase [Chloroflexales bacterium]